MELGHMIGAGVVVALVLLALYITKQVLNLRRVVPANQVHIVQSKAGRFTYGKTRDATASQNSYYEWPVWLPYFGVQVNVLPLSVFGIDLDSYEAYDSDKVPFSADVRAFFRIENPHLAAERINNLPELHSQLKASLQGAIRSVLASFRIEEIMAIRAELSQKFTNAVDNDLKEWGVETVKSVELMDIGDVAQSNVVGSIMAKRTSGIDRESRIEVAENKRAAREAEIAADQQVKLREQEAKQTVGAREAEVTKRVGIANQQAAQEVASAEKDTTAAQMAVKQVEAERRAEIDKSVAITNAEAERQTRTINAEAEKVVTVTQADAERERLERVAAGQLVQETNAAKAIQLKGEATGAALLAEKMAPVEAELKQAAGLGKEKEYQDFMVRIRQVAAMQAVGEAQAGALEQAEIKIIASAGGDLAGGLNSVGELFSAKGGFSLAAMAEAFAATEQGAAVLKKVGLGKPDAQE